MIAAVADFVVNLEVGLILLVVSTVAARFDRHIRRFLARTGSLEEISRQLGTHTRNPDWKPMEDYMHEWRHGMANLSQHDELIAGLLRQEVELLVEIREGVQALTGAGGGTGTPST